MKKIITFFSILFFIIFTGCNISEEPVIDGNRDSTSYTYEHAVTVSYYHNSEFQDSVFCVGEENDPIISGYIYRFAYKGKELFLNMNNKYYKYNTENDELSVFGNDEFYDNFTDYNTYKWYYPHLK